MSENVNKNSIGANTLPILYSLRNCPYAMRARIAIFKSQQPILLRDLVLSNKPEELIVASPKATVPVLVLVNGTVVDESLEVMLWALKESDPSDLLHNEEVGSLEEMLTLINDFDVNFKTCLEQYKCAKRYREDDLLTRREACEVYINKIEQRLTRHAFLMSAKESLADIALLPFIRQFARVERQWYLQSAYPKTRQWLNHYLQSPMFTKVMAKQPMWLDNRENVIFGQV